MKVHFYKYQATGNDFILIDNRSGSLALSKAQIEQACDRRFGIGADGLILIETDAQAPFNVNYYNSDGSQSLCGNGSRAAVHFASFLGMIHGKTQFVAYDGNHDAELQVSDIVRLKMNDVHAAEQIDDDFLIDTGSPHYVRFVEDLDNFPVVAEGRAIRYSERFNAEGVNVNFVALLPDDTLFVRTYERGVEDETLSCGTGITAAALAASYRGYKSPIKIKARGGELGVEFKFGQSGTFTDIFLIGPAKMVFEGYMEL